MYGQNLTVPYLADFSEARRKWVKSAYPATEPLSDWQDLISRTDVDAVAIATPPQTHYEIAAAALNSGKHVLIEKPMALNSADCRKLICLAEKHKLCLMVDHVYAYTSPVMKIEELLKKGEIGEILYYDSVRVNLGLFQTHVNVLWDLAPHDLSILDCFVGGMKVKEVFASGSQLPGTEHAYQVYLHLKLDNGMAANMHFNWLSPVKVRKIMLAGTRKMAIIDEMDVSEQVKIYDKGFTVNSEEDRRQTLGTYRSGDMFAPRLEAGEGLGRVIKDFATCIQTGAKPKADAYQGLRVVEVIEKAHAMLNHRT
jgi:predicted dehydrogenase